MAEAPSLLTQQEYLFTNFISLVSTTTVLAYIVRKPAASKVLDWMVRVLTVLVVGLIVRLLWQSLNIYGDVHPSKI